MNTEVTDPSKSPMDNFKAALTDKIAAEAGSVMPSDVLQQLVSESVTGMIKEGMEGRNHSKGWIRQEIETIISVQVAVHVRAILSDEDFLREAIRAIFTEELPRILLKTVSDHVEYSTQQRIQNMMQNNGY